MHAVCGFSVVGAFAERRFFAAEPRILEVRIDSTPTSQFFTPTGRSVPTRQRTSVEVGCVLNDVATISDVSAAQVWFTRTSQGMLGNC